MADGCTQWLMAATQWLMADVLTRPGYALYYGTHTYSGHTVLADELKKGTTPMLILSLLETEQRHGYELSKLLEQRTNGVVRIHAASLYPLLYRLERQRLIEGRWVEKAGERRRRFYRLTADGKRQLEAHRKSWVEFARAIAHVAGVEHA